MVDLRPLGLRVLCLPCLLQAVVFLNKIDPVCTLVKHSHRHLQHEVLCDSLSQPVIRVGLHVVHALDLLLWQTTRDYSPGQPELTFASHQEKVLCFNMHVTDANMHAPAPNMRLCKNPMSTSWQSLAWHLKTPTWHFKTSTWHFKTQNMVFQNSEHGVSLGAGHAQATTLWRARALFFLTQKKSPHGLHHLLAYDRFPSPQTSWANPAWPRTPDSDKQ
jgi:hypothetical protein